jgi:hypothetical protein
MEEECGLWFLLGLVLDPEYEGNVFLQNKQRYKPVSTHHSHRCEKLASNTAEENLCDT